MYSAPGKLILAGEHAVVYGQPAIAMPLQALRATVAAEAAAAGAGLTVHAPDLGAVWRLRAHAPLSDLAERTLRFLDVPEPDATLTISSAIPIASGMGSGAAVGAALVRALAGLAGRELDAAAVSGLVYESERAFHGTPSGIDNTVVAYERPIIFQRQPAGPPAITPLAVGGPWHFVVADTGVASETRAVVGDLRRRWEADPTRYDALFERVGALVRRIESALLGDSPATGHRRAASPRPAATRLHCDGEGTRLHRPPATDQSGGGATLGLLLNENQDLLREMGVSSPELDRLVAAALAAGAWGAKLSGGGWGGVMLALVDPRSAAEVAAALRTAGATRVWPTELAGSGET